MILNVGLCKDEILKLRTQHSKSNPMHGSEIIQLIEDLLESQIYLEHQVIIVVSLNE